MEFNATSIPEVIVIDPVVFRDSRGFFMEVWQKKKFAAAGIDAEFVQGGHSHSKRGALRGLHYQISQAQGKLVRVMQGTAFDVAIDLRWSSPTFGRWVGETLSSENRRLLWIPPGFAHGFLALSETVDFEYRMTNFYAPEHERTLRWDDPDVGIEWPLAGTETPILSEKDRDGQFLKAAEVYA